MFSIKLWDDHNIQIVQAGRGNWKKTHDSWIELFKGFDGENTLSIQLVCWQSGHTVIGMTFASVDGDIETLVKRVGGMHTFKADDHGNKEVEDAINQMILELTGQNPDDGFETWPYKKRR
jgi:hypothetical protein